MPEGITSIRRTRSAGANPAHRDFVCEVTMLGILGKKARAIANSLVEAGYVKPSNFDEVYEEVLYELKSGGGYQLLETADGAIMAKVKVVDENGKVTGMQG